MKDFIEKVLKEFANDNFGNRIATCVGLLTGVVFSVSSLCVIMSSIFGMFAFVIISAVFVVFITYQILMFASKKYRED